MKLYTQLPSTLIFLVSHKNDPSKLVHPLKIYQHTPFHDPMLAGASFAPTSEI
jgi:hypothetical protein